MTAFPVIVLVISCCAHRQTRQLAVRETWASRIPQNWKLLFVEGNTSVSKLEGDRLLLPVNDDYSHLAEKTFRAIQFVIENFEFEGLLKCDDDTFIHTSRFDSGFKRETPYAGSSRDTLVGMGPYAQGGAYWLSHSSCRELVAEPFETHSDCSWYLGKAKTRKRGERKERAFVSIEDRMVGDILRKRGIPFTDDRRFNPDPFPSVYEDSSLFSCHYVNPKTMRRIFRQGYWLQHPLKKHLVPLVKYMPASRKPR